ncbi:hypothetical protein NP233_g1884 [Leucocoprinus birnbaumii]|uniref:DNA 3'-5' helicase n=1 Tax=Leucocoprinus birnbaumii TaxID=56174 RepID=A0AAD5YXM7_9AGAR|nr:hypothetical protein NP233_g1884 [Leucocoprinus birnbaumii]
MPPIIPKVARPWPGVASIDVKEVEAILQEKFQWKHVPRPFQTAAIIAQLQRNDVLLHAGTGMGKTAVAAGPYGHPQAEGMTTFFVSPLIALQEEQVATFREEFGLEAVAVNSYGHNPLTNSMMKDICRGRWQIVVISPEMLLSKHFINGVLRNRDLIPRIMAIVVDEAHVVSHWGTDFRKMYGRLGILRALLPRNTPFVAMSATLPPRVRRDVLTKLHLNDEETVMLNLGNDRPNVSLVVRPIHNSMKSFGDLAFVIPEDLERMQDIKKTFIYADSIDDGYAIHDYLRELLPESLRDKGVIRPYNAAYTVEHRMRVMMLFKAGLVRVLVCTDAAGMGCNLPDIDLVVQWKRPSTVSAFIQRAGRAARDPGRTGVAVFLAERTAFKSNLDGLGSELVNERGKSVTKPVKKSVRQSSTYPKASDEYAITHGIRRGTHDGRYDDDKLAEEVAIDFNAIDEGLYSLIQATTCRREIARQIFGNKVPEIPPSAPCCDICCPALLDQVRPAAPSATSETRTSKPTNFAVVPRISDALHEWRMKIWNTYHRNAMWPPTMILSQQVIDKLASSGHVERLKDLETMVGEDWPWFGRYGNDLLEFIHTLDIPPPVPKPKKSRAKRKVREEEDEREEVTEHQSIDPTPTPIDAINATSTLAVIQSRPLLPPTTPAPVTPSPSFPILPPRYMPGHPVSSSSLGPSPYYHPGYHQAQTHFSSSSPTPHSQLPLTSFYGTTAYPFTPAPPHPPLTPSPARHDFTPHYGPLRLPPIPYQPPPPPTPQQAPPVTRNPSGSFEFRHYDPERAQMKRQKPNPS